MAKIYHQDTIAAIATPIGEGAIGVIRVSGSRAISALDEAFVGKSKLSSAQGYSIHFGRIYDRNGVEVDEVLCSVFRNPNSYTGEDSVEVGCHGGMLVTRKILETVLSLGLRQAEPGEFTKRAFLNGKLDLSQAEAVADLISATSEASHRASLEQLEGRFSAGIRKIRSELLDLCSLIELDLDFSEEGIDIISKAEVLEKLSLLQSNLQAMVDSYRLGKISREGVSVAIVGEPNAGKSSLFNALLKTNRAIVTPVPGTTRDSLEESISIDGIMFRISDTAGLRLTTDVVEMEGVERAKWIAGKADIIILVSDASDHPDREAVLKFVSKVETTQQIVIAYNKVDLCKNLQSEISRFNGGESSVHELLVSAKTGYGLDTLRRTLTVLVTGTNILADSIQVTNSRHRECIVASINYLTRAGEAIRSGSSGELAAIDLKEGADSIGEIVGEVTTDDMLNNIFKNFCIGK